MATLRRTLNYALVLVFLPTAASSILLYLGYRNSFLVYWHSQLGLIFVVLALLHLLVYIKYFITK